MLVCDFKFFVILLADSPSIAIPLDAHASHLARKCESSAWCNAWRISLIRTIKLCLTFVNHMTMSYSYVFSLFRRKQSWRTDVEGNKHQHLCSFFAPVPLLHWRMQLMPNRTDHRILEKTYFDRSFRFTGSCRYLQHRNMLCLKIQGAPRLVAALRENGTLKPSICQANEERTLEKKHQKGCDEHVFRFYSMPARDSCS